MRLKKPEFFEKIENFIEMYAGEYGRSPTFQEIADGVGMPRTTAMRYVQEMMDNGILSSQGTRGLRTPLMQKYKANATRVPVLSSMYAISCGEPTFADQYVDEYVDLPVSLFGRGRFFIIPTKGTSMINAGIGPGDYVIVRQQDYAEPGQIVVTLIGDEATLKRYYPEPEKKRIRLQPENDEFEPIYVSECVIQGVAVKVLKDLNGGVLHGDP